MSTVDLGFSRVVPQAGNPVELSFGASSVGPDIPPVLGALRIVLSPPTAALRVTFSASVDRKLTGSAALSWQQTGRAPADRQTVPWSQPGQLRVAQGLPIRQALRRHGLTTAPFEQNSCQLISRSCPWTGGSTRRHELEDAYQVMSSVRVDRQANWQVTTRSSRFLQEGFVSLLPLPRREALSWDVTTFEAWRWQQQFAKAENKAWQSRMPWQIGRLSPPGESLLPVDPPDPPKSVLHHPALDFICPAGQAGLLWKPALWLRMGKHSCSDTPPGVIPVLRVYFVSNTVDVVRLPGREPLPVKSVELGIDADSWAWRFTASLAYEAFELVEPTSAGPVEIEITINGVIWVMLVEGFDVARRFGQSTLNIRGRSLAAYLAEPYAPRRSFAPDVPFTARQLAEQELTRTGLVTGFTLDWGLPDWLVPPGAFSVESLSPMSVITRIAESVAGVVQAHPYQRQIATRSRYPSLPWEWDSTTADLTLPLAVVKTLNLRWQEKPAFNAAYVAGERMGIVGHITRSGSAGDFVAPMIVDGLITHADAARERGRVILADTGKQAMVTLELPMLESIGLVSPGKLISVGEDLSANGNAWRGLVRSTQIAAQWSESLSVRQTLEVERHYN